MQTNNWGFCSGLDLHLADMIVAGIMDLVKMSHAHACLWYHRTPISVARSCSSSPVPGAMGRVKMGQPCVSAHFATSTWLFVSAMCRHYWSEWYSHSRRHCNTSRCPISAAEVVYTGFDASSVALMCGSNVRRFHTHPARMHRNNTISG